MKTIFDSYPWQQDRLQHWLSNQERFAHAWLLHGNRGIGKWQFARIAAASLLCEAPVHGLACQHCPSCHLVSLGNHPDLRFVVPDAKAKELGLGESEESDSEKIRSQDIRIEQIRQLDSLCTMATHRGGRRVIVIYPAENMNTASSNALLKILEEPPPDTVFLLITHALAKLLPTILSRCRRLHLPLPKQTEVMTWLADQGIQEAEHWLAASSGAPLLALHYAQSSLEPCKYWLEDWVNALCDNNFVPELESFAIKLEQISPVEWIGTLQRLLFDIEQQQHGLASYYFPKLSQPVAKIAQRGNIQKTSQLNQWLKQEQKIAEHPLNIRLFTLSILQRIYMSFRH